MNIIKRNGEEVIFDSLKIHRAISKANKSVSEQDRIPESGIVDVVKSIVERCESFKRAIQVEEVQDLVETELMKAGYYELAKKYITYRYKRAQGRVISDVNKRVLALVDEKSEDLKQENSNKNPSIISTQRDYMAGEVSKDLARNILLPKDIVEAHDEGIIHFHDMDYYATHEHNCCLINLEDMLQNGTVISGTKIDKPHSFYTACNIATQIIAQVASSQYGGQSISLSHLAPFVDISRHNYRCELYERCKKTGTNLTSEQFDAFVEDLVRKEIKNGVQTLQYQIITLMTTNGQSPFVTLFMYLNEVKSTNIKNDLALIIEEVLKQRIQGVKNEAGIYVTPAFPKLIYVLEEDNIKPGDKYFYLTELAAKCTAKRMVPDYISEKIMLKNKIDKNGEGHCYTCMGCRSFLTPYIDDNGNPKYYGRFNAGVVTVNLPDISLSSNKDMIKFWRIFDERMELCHKALQIRHKRLRGTKADVAPILWRFGALSRLKKGETIDKLLFGGYSTLSLGYAGLWECVYSMTGKKLTEPEGKEFGLQIMKKLNEYTSKWKEEENIHYSLYGTPIESTTYKFAKALQKRHGVVKGVSDKNYITNSYHVHVEEPIDAFSKLKLESEFQLLSPGGAISYVEVPNMQNNINAVLSVMKFIYDNIIYAELNTKSDYCSCCGFDGEIEIIKNEHGKLIWRCPKCGNIDQNKMSVVRRTCGYLGSNYWNQGRTQEIKDRVLHL